MTDETLILLAGEVRGKTLKLLDGVSEDLARFTGAGLSNSTLWHAGHALVIVERLSVAPATVRPPQVPGGWQEIFGAQSRPATVPRDAWPPLAEVARLLRDQLDRLTAAIRALPPGRLDDIVDPARNRTLRFSILHGLHDEAGHQGEMYLLRKLFGKQTAAATSAGS
jgi:hypothetical protein